MLIDCLADDLVALNLAQAWVSYGVLTDMLGVCTIV